MRMQLSCTSSAYNFFRLAGGGRRRAAAHLSPYPPIRGTTDSTIHENRECDAQSAIYPDLSHPTSSDTFLSISFGETREFAKNNTCFVIIIIIIIIALIVITRRNYNKV